MSTKNQNIYEPIVDIKVIVGSNADIAAPEGYQKLACDLNRGAGGKYIYLCYKKQANAAPGDCITSLAVVSGKSSSTAAPSGYQKLPEDLNKGAGGKYIYLCYRKGGGAPISNIDFVTGTSKSAIDAAYCGFYTILQDLNEGAGGKYIYLSYQRATPVTDVTFISGGSAKMQPPEGYDCIYSDLNRGANGKYIYLCAKHADTNAPAQGIEALKAISGDSGDVQPPAGFEKIPLDLNTGAGGKYVFLSVKRGLPVIQSVGVISGDNDGIKPPFGWEKLKQDVNQGAGGSYIYICYLEK